MDENEVERITLLLNAKQFEQAAERLSKALAVDQNDYEAWGLLSGMYMAQGNPREALDAINHSIGSNPDEGVNYGAKALICLELGDVMSAAQASGLGVALEPEDSWVHAVHAIVLSVGVQQGLPGYDVSTVVQAVHRALELDDMSIPAVPAYAGVAMLNIGQQVACTRILEMGVARHPEAPELVAALGISRNPARHADAWRLLASANEMDSQALRITRLPIMGRAVKVIGGYLASGGHLVLLAAFSWYLSQHGMLGGWVRPAIGGAGALIVLPGLISHARMPRSTRKYLQDNMRFYRLAANAGLLVLACGLFASFAPPTWALVAGALGLVGYTVGLWAITRVRRAAIEAVPGAIIAVQSFKTHDRLIVGVAVMAILYGLLTWFGWHTPRTVLAMLVVVPIPLAVLGFLAAIGKAGKQVDFPGRWPIQTAAYAGNAGLIALAWGNNIWWTMVGLLSWFLMLVLRGVARRRNASAGAAWRVPTVDVPV